MSLVRLLRLGPVGDFKSCSIKTWEILFLFITFKIYKVLKKGGIVPPLMILNEASFLIQTPAILAFAYHKRTT
jgi:hypothetical protein